MQPFSSFLRASVLPPAAATLPSVQLPTFVRFLTFLYWLCHFCIFQISLPPIFHTSLSPFLLIKLVRSLVFSELFGAASCCCNFAFCSTTYVRPLCHLSLLAFVTFVFFTFRCHLFFFINSCAFSYCLSLVLPDEAYGRNVVNSTVCSSTVFCSLN